MCEIFDSFGFLASSLDSLVRTLVDNQHKTLESWKKIVGDDIIIVSGLESLVKNEKTLEDLKKGFPDQIEK